LGKTVLNSLLDGIPGELLKKKRIKKMKTELSGLALCRSTGL